MAEGGELQGCSRWPPCAGSVICPAQEESQFMSPHAEPVWGFSLQQWEARRQTDRRTSCWSIHFCTAHCVLLMPLLTKNGKQGLPTATPLLASLVGSPL